MSRGRKERLTEEKFLDAVRRKKSLEDSVLSEFLGMGRNSIWYWKNRHPESVVKAEKMLKDIESIRFDSSLSFDVFKNIPSIANWISDMESKPLDDKSISMRINVLYNIATKLNTHVDNLDVDQVAELVKESRLKYMRGEKADKGFSYYYIRKPIRAYFMQVKGISGDHLSLKGITAEKSRGWGSQAKEKVIPEQRRILPGALYEVIEECLDSNDVLSKNQVLDIGNEELNDIVLEFQNLDYWMYYTATRIQSTLNVKLNDKEHQLMEDVYKIKVIDKGEKGGQKWMKILNDDSLDRMKNYLATRFSIDDYSLEKRLPQIDDYLFPFWRKNYKAEREIQKEALKRCGKITSIPNHIFRHTFAQDFLHASDWNYELCASVGGWSSTTTLKEHYGEMSEEARMRGLKHAMGQIVEDVTYALDWEGRKIINRESER